MTTGDRHDLEALPRDAHGNIVHPTPVSRPLTLEQAALLSLGVPPHLIANDSVEIHKVFVDGKQIYPAVPPENQLHGTTPPPVLEIPIDKYDREHSVRHREDQAWIAKVTEGMRKDLKELYEDRTNFVRREMGERIDHLRKDLQSSRYQTHAKDIELKRALETVGRQQIELEELKKTEVERKTSSVAFVRRGE